MSAASNSALVLCSSCWAEPALALSGFDAPRVMRLCVWDAEGVQEGNWLRGAKQARNLFQGRPALGGGLRLLAPS